jgi:hypothetical protein
MQALRRPAPRGPVLTRRRFAGGSVLGVGLLVAAGTAAPAALAGPVTVDEPGSVGAVDQAESASSRAPLNEEVALEPADTYEAELTPFYGSGKSVDLSVAVLSGTAPDDLSLAGTEFTLTGSDEVPHVCATDASGVCTVAAPASPAWNYSPPSTALVLSPGEYEVTQTGHAEGVRGPAGSLGTVNLTYCCSNDAAAVQVVNRSIFRPGVQIDVTDAAGDLVLDTDYGLTGPDYLHRDGKLGDSHDWGTANTGEDGVLSYDGYFLPGAYTLTGPDGDPATFTVRTPTLEAAALRWSGAFTTRAHAGDGDDAGNEEQDGTHSGTPVSTPVTTPSSTPVSTPSAGPSSTPSGTPVSTPSAGPVSEQPVPSAPDAVTALPVSFVAAAAPDPVAPAATPSSGRAAPPTAAPTTSAAPVTTPATTSAPSTAAALPTAAATPTAGPDPVIAAAPALETASSSLPDLRVIALGIGFLAVVLAGLLLIMRRRARYDS